MADLTFAQVSAVLKYDPETGKLFWLPRGPELFQTGKQTAEHNAKAFNRKFAGKEAFTATLNVGYKFGAIFAKGYLAHRVAWVLAYGEWPVGQIDHINGNRTDNRINNLRDVSPSINRKNAKNGAITKVV